SHAETLIREEARFLRWAMGHEQVSVDHFIKAHRTCLEDIVYFPTHVAYGLLSEAGDSEKFEALEYEFKRTKKNVDNVTKKALLLE
ncbi:hypothetical protein Ancab_027665, partial [Ancistrocladus abbreviatus]